MYRGSFYIYILLATVATTSFTLACIQIARDYSNKNYCVNKAAKQLLSKLPEAYIEDSGLDKRELVKMLGYQLCTHRNVNK